MTTDEDSGDSENDPQHNDPRLRFRIDVVEQP